MLTVVHCIVVDRVEAYLARREDPGTKFQVSRNRQAEADMPEIVEPRSAEASQVPACRVVFEGRGVFDRREAI